MKRAETKLVRGFEFDLQRTKISRKPDMIFEDKEKKNISTCVMA